MRQHTVIWNGTPDCGGRQLFTEEHSPIRPEPVVYVRKTRHDERLLLLDLLREQPRTLRQLVDETGFDAHAVSHSLKVFRASGLVDMGIVWQGRRSVFCYRTVGA